MLENEIFSEDQINSVCNSIAGLEPMEQLRLKVKKRIKIYGTILVVTIVAAVLYFILTYYFTQKISGVVLLVIGIACIFIFTIFNMVYVSPHTKKLDSQFKENIIKHYVCSLLPGAFYTSVEYHSLDTYYESNLFNTQVDRHSGSNYVEGKFDKTDISFSYMHTEYKQVTQTKNGQKTTWHTIFKGIFMQADSNKNFAGRTIIRVDTAEKHFGRIGKWMQRNSFNSVGKMVYMENVNFEKEFVVYSTDPVEARYLLTPKIQEQILHIKKTLCKDIQMSFVNNHVFIAINRGNIFDLNYSMSFKDSNTLRYYMKDIIELISLVPILDLNTRIWGKE